MKLCHLSLIPLLLAPFCVSAHEYWIAPSSFHTDRGSQLTLAICEGHDFPKCGPFEFPDTFTGLHVIGPDGERRELEVAATDDDAAIAQWSASTPGHHAFTVQLVMSHPRRGEIPLYTTRTGVWVADGEAQQPSGSLGEGLEIFVVDNPAAGTSKDSVQFYVTHDGRPAQVSLQIQPAEGRSFSIQTGRNGEAELPRRTPGRYLAYASHQGVNGSVSFMVPE